MKAKVIKHGVVGVAVVEVDKKERDVVVPVNDPHPAIGSEIEFEADGDLLVQKPNAKAKK